MIDMSHIYIIFLWKKRVHAQVMFLQTYSFSLMFWSWRKSEMLDLASWKPNYFGNQLSKVVLHSYDLRILLLLSTAVLTSRQGQARCLCRAAHTAPWVRFRPMSWVDLDWAALKPGQSPEDAHASLWVWDSTSVPRSCFSSACPLRNVSFL